MIPIVAGIVGLFAVLSWIVAVIAAIQIVSLSPAGTKWRTYFRLGWWKFADIRAVAGPAVDPHIRTYQRAFIAFFVCILLMAVAGVFLGIAQQN
jgi:hypothetical protein